MGLQAEIYLDPKADERRGTARRSLRLEVENEAGDGHSRAIVRNLSETGLLLESATALAVDEELLVHLPEAGAVPARVIWARNPFFGCEFARPVSRSAVSAALLRSPADEPAIALTSPIDTTWLLAEPAAVAARPERSAEASLALALLAGVVVMFVLAMAALQLG
ncbi:MAG: PilZ domain-containing protein [Novosphingobium sp.]|nr:PilZ domain-containing protein [Novosphingobium sp.]